MKDEWMSVVCWVLNSGTAAEMEADATTVLKKILALQRTWVSSTGMVCSELSCRMWSSKCFQSYRAEKELGAGGRWLHHLPWCQANCSGSIDGLTIRIQRLHEGWCHHHQCATWSIWEWRICKNVLFSQFFRETLSLKVHVTCVAKQVILMSQRSVKQEPSQ